LQYRIELERGDLNYAELEPLYRRHYGEMKSRLEKDGFRIGEYKPRFDVYFPAFAGGWLLNFVARTEAGEPVGYANVYLTSDMHNGDSIATEDTVYVLPQHRNGLGSKIVKFALEELRSRGVKRVTVNPVTDLRVAKVWRRMGFREVAVTMTYEFEENIDVQ
jgi:GNAT superfamily N-acetyltransferase